MERKRAKRTYLGFSLLFVLLAVFLIWNLLAGSVSLSASEIWQILLGGGEDLTQRRIIMQIRLPRMMAALILGGALSVSGYLLQTFFHNSIAGPFVLGISSGAKLAVSLVMIFLLSRGVKSSSALLIGAAFVGAMLAMGLILLISQYVDQMSLLVVCGVMIGYTNIIRTLLERKYIRYSGKYIIPTPKGLLLYETVRGMKVADASLTSGWEAELARIERGELTQKEFLDGVLETVNEVTGEIFRKLSEDERPHGSI